MAGIVRTLKTYFVNIFGGCLRFSKKYVGKTIRQDKKIFVVFRHLTIKSDDKKSHKAIFRVKFRFKNLSLKANKKLSIIPVPFLIGMEGFRQKIWTISKDGFFQGIYEWDTEQSAKDYPDSFIFRKLTKRALPGTLEYKIIPDTELKEYLIKRLF